MTYIFSPNKIQRISIHSGAVYAPRSGSLVLYGAVFYYKFIEGQKGHHVYVLPFHWNERTKAKQHVQKLHQKFAFDIDTNKFTTWTHIKMGAVETRLHSK